ncbi:MAG: cupin domain-containing protein, partial [Deltaproteobacteria bacterium]
MARRGLGDELDDALEALMADPKGPLPGVSPRLAELLRIAGDLRGLPRAEFRAELKAALVSGAEGERSAATVSVGGRPLATLDDIRARLEEMAHEPKMVAHDVRAALRDLPEKTIRFLASLNRCTLGVSRFSGDSHWERHPAGDEMLHILEGEAEVVTLTEAGPVRSTVSAGSVFVCRRGLWHRVLPRSPVSM